MSNVLRDETYGFEEYLRYDDGGTFRYELVNGRLEAMNPPRLEHFLVAKFIESVLEREIQRQQRPWLCFRDAGIRTGFSKSRLADLCVVTLPQAQQLSQQSLVFQTPPLLVVEVVSPESVSRDYRYRRSEYAAAEISEYWIVDPLRQRVAVLQLEEGLYEDTDFAAADLLESRVFPELNLSVRQIFEAANLDGATKDT
jgi:Uma2 family endonuclease